MRIVVCVKWVGILGDDVEFDDDGNVDRDYLDYTLNEWDAAALAEALRLRDEWGGEVVAVTVGDKEAQNSLYQALAMGADRAVRVEPEDPQLHDAIAVAHLLAGVVGPEHADLVLCGAQSSDAAQGATGSALAGLLGLPCAAVVTAVDTSGPSGTLVVQRELEGGTVDVVELETPALLTIQTGITEPRFVTLRAVQQAREAAIQVVDANDLGAAREGYHLRRMAVTVQATAEMIEGGPEEVAQRITTLVREAAL